MATVTGLTAARMQEIEDASVVGGEVDLDGDLILTKHDGSEINAGAVVGPAGPTGPAGPAGHTVHRCQLLRNTTQQAMAADSWQTVLWPSAEHDPYGMHADGSGNIVLPSVGYWHLHESFVFNIAAAAGRIETAFNIDGTRRSINRLNISGSGGGLIMLTNDCVAYISSVGVVVQAQAWQTGQGAGWGVAGSNINRFMAVRLSD